MLYKDSYLIPTFITGYYCIINFLFYSLTDSLYLYWETALHFDKCIQLTAEKPVFPYITHTFIEYIHSYISYLF